MRRNYSLPLSFLQEAKKSDTVTVLTATPVNKLGVFYWWGDFMMSLASSPLFLSLKRRLSTVLMKFANLEDQSSDRHRSSRLVEAFEGKAH